MNKSTIMVAAFSEAPPGMSLYSSTSASGAKTRMKFGLQIQNFLKCCHSKKGVDSVVAPKEKYRQPIKQLRKTKIPA